MIDRDASGEVFDGVVPATGALGIKAERKPCCERNAAGTYTKTVSPASCTSSTPGCFLPSSSGAQKVHNFLPMTFVDQEYESYTSL